MIDSVRSRFPTELGCVIDAAMTSEAVAIGSNPRLGTTIVIVSRAFVGNCPAMSNIGPELYVATIGGGVLSERKKSVLEDPQWGRAREYLLRDPLAFAAELPGRRIVAVAQPDPLDGWMAIDAANPTEVEAQMNELVARWRTTRNAQLANKLRNTRKGAQVLVRIDHLELDDLVALTADVLRGADAVADVKAPAFACPPLDDNIKACKDGRELTVASVQNALQAMTNVAMAPIVAGGDVAGLQLGADAHLLLRAGDIILGVNNRRLTTQQQLLAFLTDPGKKVDVAIRRDGLDLVVTLSE